MDVPPLPPAAPTVDPALPCCSLPPAEVVRPLTNLLSLYIDLGSLEGEGEAEPMLEALPQLTALCFYHHDWTLGRLPEAVTQLEQLQRFAVISIGDEDAERIDAALPEGPWLASVRQMLLPIAIAAASLAELQAARQLEQLGLSGQMVQCLEAPDTQAAAVQVLDFARCHSPLRRLQMDSSIAADQAAVAALRQAAPHLSVSIEQDCDALRHAVMPEFADIQW